MNCILSTLMGKYRYTIQEVHEKTGLSRNTISNLYNDKATRVDYETVEKLCSLFSCQINDLFVTNDRMFVTEPKAGLFNKRRV